MWNRMVSSWATGCCFILLLLSACVIFIGHHTQTSSGQAVEGFQAAGQGLSPAAYSLVDGRCWLNSNVVADNSLGMVRHPTDARAGACVLRGHPPGNGVCDSTNAVLNNSTYVQSVAEESVDGQLECVVRMIPTIGDDDAREYNAKLELDVVTSSEAFKQLMMNYNQGVAVVAGLQVDLARSRAEADTANNNWRTQMQSDAAEMAKALSSLRDADSRTFNDVMQRATTDRQNALAGVQQQRDQALAAVDRDKAVAQVNAEYAAEFAAWTIRAKKEHSDYCQVQWADGNAADVASCKAGQPKAGAPAPAQPCGPDNKWVIMHGDISNGVNDIGDRSADNIGECKSRCNMKDTCTHIAYRGLIDRAGTCYLKSGVAAAKEASEYYHSGVLVDRAVMFA